MAEILSFLKFAIGVFAALFALLMILLVIRPKTELGVAVHKFIGGFFYLAIPVSIIYVLNPADFPGPVDDLAALVTAIFAGMSGRSIIKRANQVRDELNDSGTRARAEFEEAGPDIE